MMRVINSGVVPSLLSVLATGAMRMARNKTIERIPGTDLFRMNCTVLGTGKTLPTNRYCRGSEQTDPLNPLQIDFGSWMGNRIPPYDLSELISCFTKLFSTGSI